MTAPALSLALAFPRRTLLGSSLIKPACLRPGTVEATWREQSATYCCQLSMWRWGRMLLGTRDHKSGAIGKGKGQSPEGPRPALRLTTLTSLKRPTSCADA